MKHALILCGILVMSGAMARAETFTGRLMDSTCYHRHGTARACNAKLGTTSFMLETSKGTFYKLDYGTNVRAREALRARADKVTNPDATKAVPVEATITGRMAKHNRIHADTLSLNQ